jgi:hypothetical protein
MFAIRRAPAAVRRIRISPPARLRYRSPVLSTGANVNTVTSYEWRRQLMWGLVLIAVGVTIFLDRMDIVYIDDMWHYWPLLFVVVGINKMVGYPTPKRFTSGLWDVAVAIWLFMTLEGMYGLSFTNSWPFLIIVWGITLVLGPVIQARFGPNQEVRNEK